MKRYIALLRGINISGKNKIPMADLRSAMEEQGFSTVKTHLNSGNVIFSHNENNELLLTDQIHVMIQEKFHLDIPVFVIQQEKLKHLLDQSPNWWGTEDKGIYDNLIFMIYPATVETIMERIGEPTVGLEQVLPVDNVIFWSFDRQKYQKTNWWKKTASVGIGEMITIRTANTLHKIATM